jgi:O-acetyl-ADP-ribose deacetylase (regulator of RNase III)
VRHLGERGFVPGFAMRTARRYAGPRGRVRCFAGRDRARRVEDPLIAGRASRRALHAGARDTVSAVPVVRALWLVHPDPAACDAMRARFEGLPGVTVHATRFADLPSHDAFVTAGNAYGIMTAGIDAAVVARFGPSVMQRVQRHIVGAYLGEQPVGTAFVVETGDAWCPLVVHAPTMRIPGSIAGTDAVYRATWAAFLAVHQWNARAERPIETVCLPAMGCGFGAVRFDESARQMAAAYRHALHAPTTLGDGWDLPVARERRIKG